MCAQRYNGWTNYETWAVHLWLTNDEGSYHHFRVMAAESVEAAAADTTFSKEERARLLLADRIQEEVAEGHPLSEVSLYSDLLNAALSEVNWHEIAGAFLERKGGHTRD